MNGWKVEILDDVKSEIVAWPRELRAALDRILHRILALGLEQMRGPLVKHIEGKLWEMRSSGKDVEGRALYVAVSGKRVVVVLAFIKKKQKTSRRLIELALRRAEQVQ
jgi:phage-related protein